MTDELARIFAQLPPSSEEGSTLIASATHRLIPTGTVFLGKTFAGFPCVMIGVVDRASGSFPTSIDLEHISIRHGVAARVRGITIPDSQRFSIVLLKSANPDLTRVFLQFIFALASAWRETPNAQALAKSLREFVELLRVLREPPRNTLQGLWAELFLIANASSTSMWVNAWHKDPNEIHDFRFDDGFVEVKSWSGGERCHRFNHRQLWPAGGQACFVASLLVEPSSSGVSVLGLADSIRDKLTSDECVRFDKIFLQTLGSDHQNADRLRFDLATADGTLRFYCVSQLPRLPNESPSGVSEVSYLVDMPEEPVPLVPVWLRWQR